MSRPSRNGKEFPADARLFAVSRGPYSETAQPENAVIILRTTPKGDPVSRWLPMARKLFAKGTHAALYILDITKLVKDIPKEKATVGPGPVLKPMSRVIQKLNPRNAIVIGLSGATSLVAKLLRQEVLAGMVGEGIMIQPDSVQTAQIRDALPEAPVALHLMFVTEPNDTDEAGWREANAGKVTSSVIEIGENGLLDSMCDRMAQRVHDLHTQAVPPGYCRDDTLQACEIVFTLSPYTKMPEQTFKPVALPTPTDTTETPTEEPATANGHAGPAEASGQQPASETAAPPPKPAHPPPAAAAAAAAAAKPPPPARATAGIEVCKWWAEDRDDFYAAETHLWGLRAGASIERMPVRVLSVETPEPKAAARWARVADTHGSARVAFDAGCKPHARAFQKDAAVCISGKVLSDADGRLYISVPADEPRAAVPIKDDEMSIVLDEPAEMTAAELTRVGLGAGAVKNTVGCLLVRGSKCALVRVKPRGSNRRELAVPTTTALHEETAESAAVRTLAEHLDVDPDEYSLAPQLGTITRFPEDGAVLTLYFAFANRAPPGGRRRDEEEWPVDTSSTYDWFTLKQALRLAMNEWHSVLWEAAHRLKSAHDVGIVAKQWGCGVFGMREVDAGDDFGAPAWAGGGRAAVSDRAPAPASAAEGLDQLMDALAGVAEKVKQQEAELEPQAVVPSDPVPGRADVKKMRTTVISGWLGAGKTTLLQRILAHDLGLKMAILVNDMADVNIDAALVRSDVTVTRAEENLVELSSGCICCTLRQDLLEEVAKLANSGKYDYLVIESSGISEPLHVAETFTFEVNGTSLADVASIDTMVTVIDGPIFLQDVKASATDTLASTGMASDDQRSVIQLLVEQTEFANVIVLNKTDLMTREEIARAHSLIREFNSKALVVDSVKSDIDLGLIISADRYSLADAETHDEWLDKEHVHPDMGISSFVYRKRVPFHPGRLHEALHCRGLPTVIRSKGYIWLASRMAQVGIWSQAGKQLTLDGGQPWWAASPKEEWPTGVDEELRKGDLWQEPWGDRQQELVVIGYLLDRAAIESILDACLLTKEEFALPPQ
eukprot:gene19251-29650_t